MTLFFCDDLFQFEQFLEGGAIFTRYCRSLCVFSFRTGKTVILSLLFLVWFHCPGQTVPGAIDNYSGSASVWLNPSNISTGFVHDDLGLASVSFSFENNFAYLPAGSLWPSLGGLMKEGGTWAVFDGLQSGKEYYYRYYEGDRSRYIHQTFDLALPSMMKTLEGGHVLAFSLKQRAYLSATRMSWEIPVLITESLDYDPMQHVRYDSEGLRCSMMDWSEAALTYSTQVFDHGALKMDAGVTAKLLLGMAGLVLNIDSLSYEVESKHEMFFYDFDGVFNLSLPISYTKNIRNEEEPWAFLGPLYKGTGMGFDAGFSLTYKRSTIVRETPRSACDDLPIPYFWRFGFSLLDVGRIRFSDHLLGEQLTGESFWVDTHDFDTVTSAYGGMDLLDHLEGNSATSIDTATRFSIGLPTALSLQADVNLSRGFYCNVTWIQPVSRWLYDCAVEREALFSVAPRFETSFFGMSLPVSLYDYRYLTAGAFVRVGPLSLGTNDLLSLMGWGGSRSVDFMISLRLKLDRGDCLFDPVIDACGDRYRHRR